MTYSQFSNATKQELVANIGLSNKINKNELPDFPLLSYMPTSASAVNEVHLSDKAFKLGFAPQPNSLLSIYDAVEEETLTAALYGDKKRLFSSIAPTKLEFEDDEKNSTSTFNKNFYEDVRASSLYGYQAVNKETRSKNTAPRRNLGASSFGRNTGYERDMNLSINPSAATALSMESSLAVPQVKHVRLNNNILTPIMTAPVNQ